MWSTFVTSLNQIIMKKTLLSFTLGIAMATSAMAQCTFDQQYAGQNAGLYPAALDPVSTCVGCGSQMRYVSFVSNTTQTIVNAGGFGITVTLYIDASTVLTIEGQPAGTTYGTDLGAGPSSMGIWYNTGTVPNQTAVQGCVYVAGDEAAWNAAVGGGPNHDGIYPLTITTDARIHSTSPDVSGFGVANGSWATSIATNLGGGPIIFDTYQLVVTTDGVVSVEERVAQFGAFPNPAATALRFNMGNVVQAYVELYDLSGQLVTSSTLAGNGASLAVDNVANGMYIYRLTDLIGTLLSTNRVAIVH